MKQKYYPIIIIIIVFILFGFINRDSDVGETAQLVVIEEATPELYGLAYDIGVCESGFSATAQNSTSSAYGIGQFTDSTWEYVKIKWGMELDREDPGDQMYALIRLLNEDGVIHWETSRGCWDNKY